MYNRFYVSYNETTGAVRIDEVGKTITTSDLDGFQPVYATKSLVSAREAFGFILGMNAAKGYFATTDTIKHFLKQANFDVVVLNLYE